MTDKMRNCGNCQWFVKWKADLFGGGLCEAKDRRTKTDRGRKCREYKAMKYNRDSNRQTPTEGTE